MNQDEIPTQLVQELPRSKRRSNDAVTQFTLIVLIALDVCLRILDMIRTK